MRNLFAELLYQEAVKDPRIYIVVSDISPVGSMEKFREEFPDRFINVGVAEQSMIGICAGLAREGAVPFAYTIAAFSFLRPYEFIRDDISIPNLHVNIVGIGAGLVYSTLGPTHHTVEDVAISRMLPNFKVYSPGDAQELKYIWPDLLSEDKKSPTYLRLGKAGEPSLSSDYSWEHSTSIRLKSLSDIKHQVLIFSYGLMSHYAESVSRLLSNINIRSSVMLTPCLKPFDYDTFLKIVKSYELVVFLEEQLDLGSLGMELTALMHTAGLSSTKVLRLNLGTKYAKTYGTHEQVLASLGLDPPSIVGKIVAELRKL